MVIRPYVSKFAVGMYRKRAGMERCVGERNLQGVGGGVTRKLVVDDASCLLQHGPRDVTRWFKTRRVVLLAGFSGVAGRTLILF